VNATQRSDFNRGRGVYMNRLRRATRCRYFVGTEDTTKKASFIPAHRPVKDE